MCEELEALFSDYADKNMDDPKNKAAVAGIALPFIVSLPKPDQVEYTRRLCSLLRVDVLQLRQLMFG